MDFLKLHYVFVDTIAIVLVSVTTVMLPDNVTTPLCQLDDWGPLDRHFSESCCNDKIHRV